MLSLFVVASLAMIECPKWLPGTDQVLPQGVQLSPQQELENRLRCYCSIVKPAEELCMQRNSREACKERTRSWVTSNFPNFNPRQEARPPRRTLRMLSIEP